MKSFLSAFHYSERIHTMKKFVSALVIAIILLTQTACVIRYKLPDTVDSSEDSESSEHDVQVINSDTTRTIGDYIIKDTNGGVEIIRYIGFDTDVVIPEKLGGLAVLSIGNSTFIDREDLASVAIPNGVTSIGDDAFSGCTGLLQIDVPDSVTKIGQRAFVDCTKLKSIKLTGKIRTIEMYTFHNCYLLEDVALPDSITSIEKGAFFNCVSIVEIDLPKKLERLEADAFYGCLVLKKIELPDSLTYMGRRPFKGCFRLEEILFKGDVYTVYLGDDDYDHTELRFAVNGKYDEYDNVNSDGAES